MKPSSGRRTYPQVSRLWPFSRVYYGWAVAASVLVISFAQVPMYGPVLSIFVKPIEEDLGWNRTTIALGFTIGSLGGAYLVTAIGRLLDRYGSRWIATVSGLLIAGVMLGLAVMKQPWHFWVLFGAGRSIAQAGLHVATAVAIANWFVRMRGRATIFSTFGLRFGQSLMPLIILPIILAYSWRHAYVALAGVALALAVAPSFAYIRRRPEDYGMLPDGADPATVEAPAASRGDHDDAFEQIWTLRQAIRTRALWLLTIAMGVAMFAQTAANLHAVANFQDRGISQALAVTVATIFAGTSAVTSIVWGFVMDRIHVRYGLLLMFALFALSMAIILRADTYPMAVLYAVVFGTAQGAYSVGQIIVFANYFGRRSLGSIRGFTQPFIGSVGNLGPLLGGYLFDRYGDYQLAFTVFLGMFLVGLAAMLLASPPKRRATSTTQA